MKILYWAIKTISVLLVAIPLLLCVPGLLLHVISEELEENR